jgi:hypothetical protein
MYWDNATEEEKKKRAEERGSHYIHVFSLYRHIGTTGERLSDEEGRYRERATVRQEWKEPRPTAGAGCFHGFHTN